jgi:hypothetical protein
VCRYSFTEKWNKRKLVTKASKNDEKDKASYDNKDLMQTVGEGMKMILIM